MVFGWQADRTLSELTNMWVEGGRAGEKVSETHIEENIEAVRCSTFGRLLSNNLL